MGLMDLSGLAMRAWRPACERGSRVLVVDDDSDVVRLLAVSLKFVGFQVETAASGLEALRRVHEHRPDAGMLEPMLSGVDGFTVLHPLRAEGVGIPVLFVATRDAMEDKIHGLTAGADDYITKPFHIEEVVARLRGVLRRTATTVEGERGRRAHQLSYADLLLDDRSHEVWKADVPIELSPLQFELLGRIGHRQLDEHRFTTGMGEQSQRQPLRVKRRVGLALPTVGRQRLTEEGRPGVPDHP